MRSVGGSAGSAIVPGLPFDRVNAGSVPCWSTGDRLCGTTVQRLEDTRNKIGIVISAAANEARSTVDVTRPWRLCTTSVGETRGRDGEKEALGLAARRAAGESTAARSAAARSALSVRQPEHSGKTARRAAAHEASCCQL